MTKFYVIEGANGVGKTTIINAVKPLLHTIDNLCDSHTEFLKEPNDFGYKILSDEKANDYQRMVAMLSNRLAHHLLITGQPDTRFIVDRYDPSTFVYQCKLGDVNEVDFWDLREGLDLVTPNIYFWVKAPPKTITDRLLAMGKKEKATGIDYSSVESYYAEFFRRASCDSYILTPKESLLVTIDGTQSPMASALSIVNKIWEYENKSQ